MDLSKMFQRSNGKEVETPEQKEQARIAALMNLPVEVVIGGCTNPETQRIFEVRQPSNKKFAQHIKWLIEGGRDTFKGEEAKKRLDLAIKALQANDWSTALADPRNAALALLAAALAGLAHYSLSPLRLSGTGRRGAEKPAESGFGTRAHRARVGVACAMMVAPFLPASGFFVRIGFVVARALGACRALTRPAVLPPAATLSRPPMACSRSTTRVLLVTSHLSRPCVSWGVTVWMPTPFCGNLCPPCRPSV